MSTLLKQINELRNTVGKMIENKESYTEIYKLNVKLDKLIDEYYKINNHLKAF